MDAQDQNPSDVTTIDADGPSRRCWRCLTRFACSADDATAGATHWWLCAPCHLSLIGSQQGAHR